MSRNPEQMLGFVIHDVARLLRRRFEQYARAAELDLTRTQCAVLAHLARQQGINQATLAQILDVEPITLVRLLDRLQGAGLIERKPDPKDRRAYVLAVTAKARPVLARIYELADEIYQEAQTGFSSAESDELLGRLHRIKSNLLRRTAEDTVAVPAASGRKRRA